jgi:hypothetical protein
MESCVASETPSLPRQIDVDKDGVRPQLGAKTQARLALCGRTDDLYLAGVVQQCRQVLGGQGLVFDNNSSDPDPHENKS